MKIKKNPAYDILAILFILAVAALDPRPASALEISLEENRSQRGNIGYVDLQKVFKLYPETRKAKQNFAEVVHQAEEQVNLKKAELLNLRWEISQLISEQTLLLKTPVLSSENRVSTAAASVVVPQKTSIPPPPDGVGLPGSTRPLSDLLSRGSSGATTDAGVAASTAAQVNSTSSTTVAAAPLPLQVIPAPAPAVAASTPTVQSNAGLSLSNAAAQAEPLAAGSSGSEPDIANLRKTRLGQIAAALDNKRLELARKEAEFKTYEEQVEKNLLDLENRRSDILLGKIYTAIRAVAHENGISVVVDKSQILFGHDTVDLTDKVLKKLAIPQQ